MPRAYCHECGSEVPVDPDGVCHVGHVVDLSDAASQPTAELEVDLDRLGDDPDEPLPWVADVAADDDAPAPPPSAPMTAPPAASAAPVEPAWSPADEAGTWPSPTEHRAGDHEDPDGPEPGVFDVASTTDDLAAAAAAAAATTGTERETAPTSEPSDGSDLDDLDDLDAVVSLGFDDESDADVPATGTPSDGAAGTSSEAGPAAAADRGSATDPAADPEPEASRPPAPPASPAADPADAVDLSNFTAKGGKVDDDADGRSARKGVFRLRR